MSRPCRNRAVLLLLVAATAGIAQTSPDAKPGSSASRALVNNDEQYLRRAGISTKPAALLELLRNHSRTEIDLELLEKLVRQLGDEDFARRDEATRGIVALGRPALKRLAEARKDSDAEVRRRAGLIADEILKSLDPNTAFAAVRELLRQRAEGAAAALLAYLPFADADVEEDIYFGIDRVAVRDGKVDPALTAALADSSSPRRALAALALGRLGDDSDRRAVRRCLSDTDAVVRLRAAQGLLSAHDDAALPALVALLETSPIDLAWQAEELLRWVAGAAAPAPRVGQGEAAMRRTCRTGWDDWLRATGRIDWARVARDHRRPGLILVCGQGRVTLLGCDGNPAWQISNLGGAVDAHLLSGGRLLIAEQGDTPRVLERDLFGKILWEYQSGRDMVLVSCQRLANGSTLVVSDEGIIELTPQQHELYYREQNSNNTVFDAVKRRNAPTLCLVGNELLFIEEITGLLLRKQNLEGLSCTIYGKLFAQSDGGVLINRYESGKLVHLDSDGAVRWEAALAKPTAVAGLRNGNVLAASAHRENRLVELSRSGQTVWEARIPTRVKSVRPCFNLLRVGLDHPRPNDFNLDGVAGGVKGLTDPDLTIRRRSADLLADLGPLAAPAIPVLVKTLTDPDGPLREKAGAALTQVGLAATPALLDVLKDGPPVAREAAANALGQMNDGAKASVPQLQAFLSDTTLDLEVRRTSARVLGYFGNGAAPAVKELLAALKNQDDVLRYLAAASLGLIAAESEVVVPALVAALKDPVPMVRSYSTRALAAFGPAALSALPALVEVVENAKADADLRQAAVTTIGAIGERARAAVPTLAKLLSDRSAPTGLRGTSAEALTRLGPAANDALPAFLDVLKDETAPNELTRVLTVLLAENFREKGIPTLVRAAKEGARPARFAAIQALAAPASDKKIAEPPSKEVLDALMELAAKDADADIRAQATRSLKRLEALNR